MIPALLRSMQGRRGLIVAGAVVIVLGSVVPLLFAHPHPNYDSIRYLAAPSLGSGQLPLVPALFALAGRNAVAIGLIQAVIGGACWCFLLSEAARAGHWIASTVGAVAVVLIACSTYVVQWYAALLSDSLSISLLVLMFAFGARWLRTRGALWPLAVASALWALTRATNAYVLVIGGLVILPLAIIRHRRALPLLAGVLLVAAFATFVSAQGQLWQQPFFHSLTERILPNPSFRSWFASHRMPVTPDLTDLAGPYTGAKDSALNSSPVLAGFRHWLDHSGRSTYTEFLATHIPWVLGGTFGHHEELGPRLISYYGGGAVGRRWYPSALQNLLLSERQPEMLIALGAAAATIGAAAWKRRLSFIRREVAVWAYAIGLGLAALAIDWAGDSWEVGRHSVDGTLAVILAAVMVVASFPAFSAAAPARSAEAQLLQPADDSCLPSDRVPS